MNPRLLTLLLLATGLIGWSVWARRRRDAQAAQLWAAATDPIN